MDGKLRIRTPYGWFWVRKKALIEAFRFVTNLNDSGVSVRVGGSCPSSRFSYDSPLLYTYHLELGIYADTGNPYVICRVTDERSIRDEETGFISHLDKVVYEDFQTIKRR